MRIKMYVDDFRPAPDDWVLARTVTEALRLLYTQDVDEVSLDHDVMHAVSPLKVIPLPTSVAGRFTPEQLEDIMRSRNPASMCRSHAPKHSKP